MSNHTPDEILNALIVHDWKAHGNPFDARMRGEYMQAEWMRIRREGEALAEFMTRKNAELDRLADIGEQLLQDGYVLKVSRAKPGIRPWAVPADAVAWRIVTSSVDDAFGMFDQQQLVYVIREDGDE